ncbi:helix-turn-helix domain-containing protein [Phytomonospora sp. NPDC050363]|uniref:winged helix-turn-helix domain-containing protein n=1 Tax=Phytomonospora sp. NPDC050363 TaxID=3155642 RepID=UPI0033F1F67B
MATDIPEHPPVRKVSDPAQLRALAHPLRFTLMELLLLDGPATATELGAKLGESPANCSWHLRQLAKFGYVAEAPPGPGRRRPWQVVVHGHTTDHEAEADPEYASAHDALAVVALRHEFARLDEWYMARRAAPREWRGAAGVTQSLMWLTADELAGLQAEIQTLVQRHRDRVTDPARRPSGAEPVRFVAWGIPARAEYLETAEDPTE